MNSTRFIIKAVAQAACLIAAANCTVATAGEAVVQQERAGFLEELVVTARKREESFMDVPQSLTVVNAGQLEAYDTQQLIELQYSVPNMYMDQTNSGKRMSVRGFGNVSINSHFDQAVGFSVDGLSLQRSSTWELGYFDVERVEVLRGPQGSYFGRNTTAGLVNVTTRGASDEFEGSVSVGYEDETEEQLYKFSVSGPMTDNLGGRLALQYRDSDGWMESTPSPIWEQQVPQIEETLGRLTLEWAPADNVQVTSKTAFTEFEQLGDNVQYIECNPGSVGFMAAALALGVINNIDDCTPDDRMSGAPGIVGGFNPEGSTFRTWDGWTQSLNIEWDLGEYTFVSVTGYQEYETHAHYAASQFEAPTATADNEAEWDDFSQEFRLLSPQFDWGSYVLGVFYNTADYDQVQPVDFNFPVLTLGALPFAATAVKPMVRDQQSFAVFGEFIWKMSDDWRMTIGGRYTKDEKDIHISQTMGPLGDGDDFTDLGTQIISSLTGWQPFDLRGSDEYSDFTPSVTLEWDFSDTGNAYLSYKEGFKSGGFDQGVSSSGPAPEPTDIPIGFAFDSEEVTAIEAGMKLELPDQRILLSAAIFYMEFTDLQVQAYAPGQTALVSPNLITRNATDSTSEGIELEMIWQATDNLRINAGLAYLDATYDSFPDAPCWDGQTAATGCDPATLFQDLSGETLVMAPELSANIGFVYHTPLGDSGLELEIGGDVGYRSEVNLAPNYQPGSESEPLTMVNATVALKGQDDRWEVRLIGRNLSDDQVLIHHQSGIADAYYGAINPPRRYQARFTYNF